ncbi:helix-turn-helix domain-containing protein [Psychroserpens luteus]|uniref:Helix-turn-helix domain-containing protein n=1 Tax=Psychroserpens luteus TaxID=1434066 RepID=A0ABW5ZW03_9FLAO|nr:helix-turn-helix domain-containing protein [Psychroserpens luteus]
MDLNYNLLNIITLFGAIQGLILCIFLYKKRITNKLALHFFLLFLFSLAFYNLIYALLDMQVFQYYRPLHMFPFPYKWLIGTGFYFYIKNQFPSKDGIIFHKKEWYLFAPAIVYALLRTYWFGIAINENSYRITKVLVDSDFFRIHEFFYQFFTIFLLIASLRIIKTNEEKLANIQKSKPVIQWLKRLTIVFLAIMIIDVFLYSTDLLLHDCKESFVFSYPTFILNTALIYWIGYMGFTKPKLFFNAFHSIEPNTIIAKQSLIAQKINRALDKELYTNPNITLALFASEIDSSPKELSKYINEIHQKNFSEFLNFHRIEKVKQLLASPEANKFTLVTLAEDAGFSSKSSFNSSFKKVVGMTPSAYKKLHA